MDELRARWRGAEGQEILRQVLTALQKATSITAIRGFGVHDGRVDLRGIPFPVPFELYNQPTKVSDTEYVMHKLKGHAEFRNCRFEDLDLSYGNLRGAIFRKTIFRNTRITGSDCRGWKTYECRFQNVNFDESDLRHVLLGGGLRQWFRNYRFNLFINVSFRFTDLREAIFSAPLFEDCDFSYAKLEGVNFAASRFVRSKFAGQVYDVQFAGVQLKDLEDITGTAPKNEMIDIDMTEADIELCTFSNGIDLTKVRLPTDAFLITDMDRVARELPSIPEVLENPLLADAVRRFLFTTNPRGSATREQYIATFKDIRSVSDDDASARTLLWLLHNYATSTGKDQ